MFNDVTSTNLNTQVLHNHDMCRMLSHISGMNDTLPTLLRTMQFSTKGQLLYPVYVKDEPEVAVHLPYKE